MPGEEAVTPAIERVSCEMAVFYTAESVVVGIYQDRYKHCYALKKLHDNGRQKILCGVHAAIPSDISQLGQEHGATSFHA